MKRLMWFLLPLLVLAACAGTPASRTVGSSPTLSRQQLEDRRAEVQATERAFARSMAERDFAAFESFLDPDAVFFNGKTPLVGPDAIKAVWQSLYRDAQAPFSWEPETVVVLRSGDLAHSSGPVRSPDGKVLAEFNSVWRRIGPGVWKIVFDKGCSACAGARP